MLSCYYEYQLTHIFINLWRLDVSDWMDLYIDCVLSHPYEKHLWQLIFAMSKQASGDSLWTGLEVLNEVMEQFCISDRVTIPRQSKERNSLQMQSVRQLYIMLLLQAASDNLQKALQEGLKSHDKVIQAFSNRFLRHYEAAKLIFFRDEWSIPIFVVMRDEVVQGKAYQTLCEQLDEYGGITPRNPNYRSQDYDESNAIAKKMYSRGHMCRMDSQILYLHILWGREQQTRIAFEERSQDIYVPGVGDTRLIECNQYIMLRTEGETSYVKNYPNLDVETEEEFDLAIFSQWMITTFYRGTLIKTKKDYLVGGEVKDTQLDMSSSLQQILAIISKENPTLCPTSRFSSHENASPSQQKKTRNPPSPQHAAVQPAPVPQRQSPPQKPQEEKLNATWCHAVEASYTKPSQQHSMPVASSGNGGYHQQVQQGVTRTVSQTSFSLFPQNGSFGSHSTASSSGYSPPPVFQPNITPPSVFKSSSVSNGQIGIKTGDSWGAQSSQSITSLFD